MVPSDDVEDGDDDVEDDVDAVPTDDVCVDGDDDVDGDVNVAGYPQMMFVLMVMMMLKVM